MCEPEYETIWNGGEGLTTVGAQRPGAVIGNVTDGYLGDWLDVQAWQRAHTPTTARGRHAPWRATDGITGGTVATRIALHDIADTPDRVYRWLEQEFAARWSRVLKYSYAAPAAVCELCRHPMRTYAGTAIRARVTRTFRTPCHRHVCDHCHTLYRMARGRWPGALHLRPRAVGDGLWPLPSDPVQAARVAKHRAQHRLYARRLAAKRKAARAPRSA